MPGSFFDCVSIFPNNYNFTVPQNLECPTKYYLLDVEVDNQT